MPQPDTWQYYLLNDDLTPKSYNYADDLVINDTPVPLENTPDGWQDQLVNWARNAKYYGLFRSYTNPLKFVTEGKKALRNLFYINGLEEVVNLLIKKVNNSWTYDNYYKGEIDFSKFSDSIDYCTVNIMEGGLSKMITAKEGTNYEIPINTTAQFAANNTIPVKMEGIPFKSTLTYVFVEGGTSDNDHTIGVQFVSKEGTSIGVLTGNSPLQTISGVDFSTNDDRFIVNSSEQDVTINYKQTFSFSMGIEPSAFLTTYRAYFKKNTGAEIDIIPLAGIVSGDYSYDIDINITLAKDEKLFIIGSKHSTGPISSTIIYHTSNVAVSFDSSALPTTIQALPVYYVYKELIKQITDNVFVGQSDILSERTDLVLISGDAIRNLPNSVLKTNLNDFFKWAYAQLNVGLGYEDDKAKLEDLAYFFDNTHEIADLLEVIDLELSVAEDLFFNSIKAGYPDQKYDDVNGKDEFNSTQTYQLPITRIVKEWDLTSPYRADSIGAELIRANLTEKKTTDSDSDNDVFIIQVETDAEGFGPVDVNFTSGTSFTVAGIDLVNDFAPGSKVIFSTTSSNNITFTVIGAVRAGSDTAVTTIETTVSETATAISLTIFKTRPKKGPYDVEPTGLISPTGIYNIELSPHRNLLNHNDYLASITDKLDTKNITFQSALKNAELVASVGGVEITEKADILVSTLGAKLFLPYYFKFKTQVPIDLVDLMATNSRGYFSFSWLGNSYKGFPIDISIKPADNDIQEFKLLCCPDVDLTKLI